MSNTSSPEQTEQPAKSAKSYYRPIEDRLRFSRVAIDGALANSDIQTALSEFGYDEQKLKEGRALLDEATESVNQHKIKYGEQYESTKEINDAVETADSAYKKALTVARIALKGEKKAEAALYLSGRRFQSYSRWLAMVQQFFDNLLSNPDWIKKMEKYKFDQARLKAGKGLVETVKDLEIKQTQKKGEAQDHTKAREKKLDELDEWVSDFKDISFAALDERPQLLEKLGFVIPS